MKKTGLERLREPFEEHLISKLPKPYKKDSAKGNCKECGGYHGLPAAHLDYVGHAALTDRLLEVDPNWTWEPLAIDEKGLPRFDANGGLWIKLTVCGMTRLGYGNASNSSHKEIGSREKEVIGDALRNAGMRFGAALELWHKGELHLQKDSEEDINSSTSKEDLDYLNDSLLQNDLSSEETIGETLEEWAKKPPKVISNRASSVIRKEDLIVRYGKEHVGKKFFDVSKDILDEMYKYAQGHRSGAGAIYFINDYEQFFGEKK